MKRYLFGLVLFLVLAAKAFSQNPTLADTNRLTRIINGRLGIDTNGAVVGQVPRFSGAGVLWGTPSSAGGDVFTMSNNLYTVGSTNRFPGFTYFGTNSAFQISTVAIRSKQGGWGLAVGTDNGFNSGSAAIAIGSDSTMVYNNGTNLHLSFTNGNAFIQGPAGGNLNITNGSGGTITWNGLTLGSDLTTNNVSDARYVIKSGFSSGAQAVDGVFSVSNNFIGTLTNLLVGPTIIGSNGIVNSGSPLYIQNPTSVGSVRPAGAYIVTDNGLTTGLSMIQFGSLANTNTSFQVPTALGIAYLSGTSYILSPATMRMGIASGGSYKIMVGWTSATALNLNTDSGVNVTTIGSGGAGSLTVNHGTSTFPYTNVVGTLNAPTNIATFVSSTNWPSATISTLSGMVNTNGPHRSFIGATFNIRGDGAGDEGIVSLIQITSGVTNMIGRVKLTHNTVGGDIQTISGIYGMLQPNAIYIFSTNTSSGTPLIETRDFNLNNL